MTTMPLTLELRDLGKQRIRELAAQAKRFGMTPERYVTRMLEENLQIAREARTKTFAQILGPGGPVDETALDRLVEASRTAHHRAARKKR